MKQTTKGIKFRALAMYQNGDTIKDISRELGVSASTITRWAKRLGASRNTRRVDNAFRSIKVNITEENWRELQKQKVASVYINEALKFYAAARKKNDGQLSLFDF